MRTGRRQGEEASEVEIAYELLVMRFLPPPPLSLLGESSAAASGALEDVAEEDLLEDFADQVAPAFRHVGV